MTDIAISVKHLTKVYKLYQKPSDRLKEVLHPLRKKYHADHYSLNDVSFDIKKGETVGIIGKNGAGKSTLLKIITGVLTPTSGSVQVNGKIASLLELGAGFNPDYTGLENVYFQGMLMGYSREEMAEKVDAILAFADIGEFIHQPVKTYSSGMFARLAFSVAINVNPDILIVDEALSVGDVEFQVKCYARMNSLRESGVTIIFVSHDTYAIKTFCDNAAYLKNGTLIKYGKVLDVINEYKALVDKQTQISRNKIIPLQRYDYPVEINKIFFQNESINAIFSLNDSMQINVEYTVNDEALTNIVPVLNIYRQHDNLYVFGTTLLIEKKTSICCHLGKNCFSISLNEINLLPGRYRVRIALNEKNGLEILAEENEALIFSIRDEHRGEGIYYIKQEWSFD